MWRPDHVFTKPLSLFIYNSEFVIREISSFGFSSADEMP